MRCPSCAAEIPHGSRFCGICGRSLDGERHGGGPPGRQRASASEGEIALSRAGGGLRRVGAVLILDLLLAGAGIAMILSFLGRGGDRKARQPDPPAAGAPVRRQAAPAPGRGARAGDAGAARARARSGARHRLPVR